MFSELGQPRVNYVYNVLILLAHQAKLIQDEIDAKANGKVKSMKEFIEEYLPRKYGLPALVGT